MNDISKNMRIMASKRQHFILKYLCSGFAVRRTFREFLLISYDKGSITWVLMLSSFNVFLVLTIFR